MEFFGKLLETLSLKKEQWIPILIAIIIGGSIGGWLYISSQRMQIETLEKEVQSWKDMVKEQRENHQLIITHYEKRIQNIQISARTEIEAEIYKKQYDVLINKK